MKRKKLTDEEIGQFIGKIAEKIRSEMDYDFRVAHGQMHLAENELVATFTPEQLKLYEEFKIKREEFYSIASEIYERKF